MTYDATYVHISHPYRGKPVVHGSDITTTETASLNKHRYIIRMESLSPFSTQGPHTARPGSERDDFVVVHSALVLPSPKRLVSRSRDSEPWAMAVYMHASFRVHSHARSNQEFTNPESIADFLPNTF